MIFDLSRTSEQDQLVFHHVEGVSSSGEGLS